MRLARTVTLFVTAAIAEIGVSGLSGGACVNLRYRLNPSRSRCACYRFVATLQDDSNLGRVPAA